MEYKNQYRCFVWKNDIPQQMEEYSLEEYFEELQSFKNVLGKIGLTSKDTGESFEMEDGWFGEVTKYEFKVGKTTIVFRSVEYFESV